MTAPRRPESESLTEAARVLHRGGLIAYPTEAVYGIGCDPGNEDAVHRLIALKKRSPSKGLILIAAEISQLHTWMGEMPDERLQQIMATWPGPVTWIVPAGTSVKPALRGENSGIAVRVSAHPLAAELCLAFGGPVVSTSANLSDHPPAKDIQSVQNQFGTGIDYYLDGPLGGRDRPSEIRDAFSGAILRA